MHVMYGRVRVYERVRGDLRTQGTNSLEEGKFVEQF